MYKFYLPTEIIAGRGSLETLPQHVLKFGKRVLLVTDAWVVKTEGFRRVKAQLDSIRAEISVVSDVTPEPTGAHVKDIIARLGSFVPDIAVAIGGGSVIDVTKALCILATNGGPIEKYDGTDVYTNRPLPLIAIPTTAGTGSEVSQSLNVSDTETKAKLSIRHQWNRAVVAILDPVMMAGMPAKVAFFPGVDAITHALEAYVSKMADSFSDAFAERAMILFGRSFEPFLADTNDLDAAADMQIGAAMAGVAFNIARTGYVHGLGRGIGGHVKIPHGHLMAIGLPLVIAFNRDYASEKLARAARYLLPAANVSGDDGKAIDQLIEYFQSLMVRFDFRSKLSDFGAVREDLPQMAAYASSLKYEQFNPRPATEAQLLGLLESML